MAICVLAFAYTGLVIFQKLMFGVPVEGWPSIMAAILIIGGVNILSSGIIAVYLAKVFYEVKQRPLAVVREVYRAPKSGDAQPTRAMIGAEEKIKPTPGERHAADWHAQLPPAHLDA
jgi:hypothetical protein